MLPRLRNYFIGSYLSHDDVFERARAIMLFRFTLIFTLIFTMPVVMDYFFGLKKAFAMHLTDFLLLLAFPFIIKKLKNLDKAINVFFGIIVFTSMAAFMMLNPMHLEIIGVSWAMLFLLLSALLQKGKSRLWFCLFLGWLPIFYVLLNIALDGALTWPAIVQDGAESPPVILLFMPIVIGINAIWTHTQTIQMAKETITLQKKIIQEKNNNITDSINYASRIQQAKLPDKKLVSGFIPEHFILFRPKDIVSGDFYYFFQKGEKLIMAAADCTGHGVPGAFMSMIGIEKLNDAVNEFDSPSEILSALNKKIKSSLNQLSEEASTRDGMDIALCFYDKNTQVLSFSGANRPLWISRKGNGSMEEYKPTKRGIGGITPFDQKFEEISVTLNAGDAFYIFTDGFADSFSSQHKKMTTKRFREILEQNTEMKMKERGNFLENYLNSWIGDTEQIDDVLVMGFRPLP